ncbi:MAG: DNA polymerase III subunit epsilon [Kiloniellales bacterium]|nr:DNA polymerase III subunit epsilon [Kiloniellales bacterium]
MREIVLDTETTGLDPGAGHRIVEIACLELVNHVETGAQFQRYIDPQRDMPEEAFQIHGLSRDFLSGFPPFAEMADEFLAFIGDATLVIHNAEFDMKFLNAELALLGRPAIERSRTVDTVSIARRKFPGSQVSLDALCRRFEIDNSQRTLHGALLDTQLLAEVYLELIGGRQPGLELNERRGGQSGSPAPAADIVRPPRPHAPSEDELRAHKAMLARLKDPVWLG